MQVTDKKFTYDVNPPPTYLTFTKNYSVKMRQGNPVTLNDSQHPTQSI